MRVQIVRVVGAGLEVVGPSKELASVLVRITSGQTITSRVKGRLPTVKKCIGGLEHPKQSHILHLKESHILHLNESHVLHLKQSHVLHLKQSHILHLKKGYILYLKLSHILQGLPIAVFKWLGLQETFALLPTKPQQARRGEVLHLANRSVLRLSIPHMHNISQFDREMAGATSAPQQQSSHHTGSTRSLSRPTASQQAMQPAARRGYPLRQEVHSAAAAARQGPRPGTLRNQSQQPRQGHCSGAQCFSAAQHAAIGCCRSPRPLRFAAILICRSS